jgi:D-3-phosphoglycerate dehydrogenase / 2-oxoglutarate reductase
MKVLISDKLSSKVKEILEKNGIQADEKVGLAEDELIKIIPEYDALIVRSDTQVTAKILNASEKLKIVGRAGVGTDNIDKEAAKELGIVVENTPFGNTNAAAEHTLTLLMLLSKHIVHSNASMKNGDWDRKSFKGRELKGKTLGLIGFGNVGSKVGLVAKALEMSVVVYDPFVDDKKLAEFDFARATFEELILASDYISPHVPLNDKTKNMIDKEQFNKMKEGVRILNVARGGVINEQALLDAIKSGKVAAAALDVYSDEPPTNKELIENEKVIATPHLGASTVEAQENVALDVAEQIIQGLNNGKIMFCVNGVEKLR